MSDSSDLPVLRALRDAYAQGVRCALATIIQTRGSTPRKEGSRMLVLPNRALVGTVGGGGGEAEVLKAADRVLEGGPAEVVSVDLTRDLRSWSSSVCGGVMKVLVEAVEPPS